MKGTTIYSGHVQLHRGHKAQDSVVREKGENGGETYYPPIVQLERDSLEAKTLELKTGHEEHDPEGKTK